MPQQLRCDGEGNRVGSPCVRCRRLSLPCEIDTSYKRVSKRLSVVHPRLVPGAHLTAYHRRINELAEEVERLRSAVDGRRTEPSISSTKSGSSVLPSSRISANQQQPPACHPQPPPFQQQSNSSIQAHPSTQFSSSTSASAPSSAGHSRYLEHITLDIDQINDLFQMSVDNLASVEF